MELVKQHPSASNKNNESKNVKTEVHEILNDRQVAKKRLLIARIRRYQQELFK
ncbi:unnamed protein product [Brugia timori]|uniref:Uncharacterized protein n=1 Tax=Brugia timori TaxID=42155 RepID=A0A0R3QRB3_9BILA|nr:unnamed protein product [Brugia timori]